MIVLKSCSARFLFFFYFGFSSYKVLTLIIEIKLFELFYFGGLDYGFVDLSSFFCKLYEKFKSPKFKQEPTLLKT